MFAEMMVETNQETLKRIFRTNIQQAEQPSASTRPMPANLKMQHNESDGMGFVAPPQRVQQGNQPQSVGGPPQLRQPIKTEKKVGRNDPCSCGSGNKYKKCCGQVG